MDRGRRFCIVLPSLEGLKGVGFGKASLKIDNISKNYYFTDYSGQKNKIEKRFRFLIKYIYIYIVLNKFPRI